MPARIRNEFRPTHSLTRRDFLRSAAATAALVAAAPATFAQSAPTIPGKERLIVNSYRFLDLEMPLEELHSWVTPVELFFVRNHVAEPFAVNMDEWTLSIVGEVERPLKLTMSDLAKLQHANVVNTLECAGNGRSFYEPHVPGIQWRRGAVGTARFTGPRLRDVLMRAGLKPTARHVAFRGLEEPPSAVPQFIRSVPIEKALDPHTLVALQMNGATLGKHHGFPVRVLVPGWVGAASVKWLREISVLDHEFVGNYMKPGYRIPAHPVSPGDEVRPEDTVSLTALNVKSVIAHPAEGATVRGQVRIDGAAWAGENEIVKVELSTDGGQNWQPAQLGSEQAKFAWRLWSLPWRPQRAGEALLMARATDSAGRVQPEAPPWNPAGYLWNGWDKVKVNVG